MALDISMIIQVFHERLKRLDELEEHITSVDQAVTKVEDASESARKAAESASKASDEAGKRAEEARKAVAKSDVEINIATGLKLYEVDNGKYPDSQQGLQALVTRPAAAANWKGPYLDNLPLDPWGRLYQYRVPGTHSNKNYNLYSLGRDGLESDDDIVNWEE